MVFEPTFEELGERSSQLAAGADPDADVSDQDVAGAADAGQDDDGLAEAESAGSIAVGDVEADDLPPYGA